MARSVRALWFVCAVFPGLAIHVSSCSADSAAVGDAQDAAPDTRQRPPPPDPEDAADDADSAVKKPPPPVLPTCVGTSLKLQSSGERVYVGVNMGVPVADGGDAGDAGAGTGAFLLDFGANGSTIDLGGFNPPGPPQPATCNGGDASFPGAYCEFPNFDFFGPWGTVTLVTGDYRFLFTTVRQAGIIGTDFLALNPYTVDYTRGAVWRAATDKFCTEAQLLGAGFSPLPAGGFYTNKFSSLRPLSDVISHPDAAATKNIVVPNIPTVPITVGGASALAQLDTGYDDRIIRHSININAALLAELLKQSPVKITRQQNKDLYLTTCVAGVSQLGAAWVLAAGTEVNFVGEGGTVGRRDSGTVLFVKESLPAAEKCGGIETWTVPAAQMGASFLVDAQAVIFDPVASRVWLPKN